MTNQTNTDANADSQQGLGDLFMTTAAGWVLGAAAIGLGLYLVSSGYFHAGKPERPEQLGYVIEGVEDTGGGKAAEITMAQALNMEGVTAEAGAKLFAKCQSCHTIEAGGANGVGPNLNGVMGANVGAKAGFAYSTAMAGLGGTWGWDEMNEWLKRPASYLDGTKMAFAGIRKIEDRASIALYMNENGSNLPIPEFVATETEETVADEAAVEEAEANQENAEAVSEETAEAEA